MSIFKKNTRTGFRTKGKGTVSLLNSTALTVVSCLAIIVTAMICLQVTPVPHPTSPFLPPPLPPTVRYDWWRVYLGDVGGDPHIAKSDSGYGVVWATSKDDERGDVYLQLAGSEPHSLSNPILVSEGRKRAGHPSIAWDGHEYAVVWADRRNDGTWSRLYLARFTIYGERIGGDIQLTNQTIGHSTYPHLLWNGTGYGLFWISSASTSNAEVFMTRLSPTGTRAMADRQLTANGTGNTGGLSAVWNGSSYGIVWQSPVASQPSDAYLQRVSLNGDPAGEPLRLTSNPQPEPFPAIAWNGSSYAVTWKEQGEEGGLTTQRVKFAGVSSDGQLLNEPFYLSGITHAGNAPLLAWDGHAYGAVWNDSRVNGQQVYFSELDASGNRLLSDVPATEEGTAYMTNQEMFYANDEIVVPLTDIRNGGVYLLYGKKASD